MAMRVDAFADILVELQRVAALAVGDAFDAGHQPGAAHLADQRQLLQCLQFRLEIRPDFPRVLKDATLQQVEEFFSATAQPIGWLV